MHTEEDVRSGRIQEFLEMNLPNRWDYMDLNLKREYIQNYRRQEEEGNYKREKVCALEIWYEWMGGDAKNSPNIRQGRLIK